MSSSGDHHEETGPEPSPPEQPKPRCALCMEGDYETCDGKHPCQVCTVIGRPRECHYPRAGKVAKKVQVKEEPNQHQAPITIEDSDSNNLVCRQEITTMPRPNTQIRMQMAEGS
ncbi:hypothetical protein HYQ45_002017 [Verticillium longisporum]|uniref:Zn(2)-C6 fungal-type domain-containing protein n=1 Tax=Verticillium longisporum TaxID=100787 RepID=A0A8I2ZY86_VERLO|nr:hypothetical protein HYQ45_002017 [Verticillium longisporum]KAG7151103.1 hypothetical protein HYQ46_013159 [Verticillium longisporum]